MDIERIEALDAKADGGKFIARYLNPLRAWISPDPVFPQEEPDLYVCQSLSVN